MKASPFYYYTVTSDDGSFHSSIHYTDSEVGKAKSQDEIREELLEIISAASCEYEFPEHGEAVKKNPKITLYGPFFPGQPIMQMTHAEYNAIDEGDLP